MLELEFMILFILLYFHFHFISPFQGAPRKQNLSHHSRYVFPYLCRSWGGGLLGEGMEMGKGWRWWNLLTHPETSKIKPGLFLCGFCLETLRVIGITRLCSIQNGRYHCNYQLMAGMLLEQSRKERGFEVCWEVRKSRLRWPKQSQKPHTL